MKNRFVLGIVLVLCVQVAFEVLMALEQAGDRYLRARVTTTVPSPVDTSPLMVAAIPYIEADLGPALQPSFTAPLRQASAAKARLRFAPSQKEHNAPPLFETITITYPGRPAILATPGATTSVPRTERPQKEDRSLFARTVVPVVKKPYEFLKLVGSKLR